MDRFDEQLSDVTTSLIEDSPKSFCPVFPWEKAIKLIIWGLSLETFGINFFGFDTKMITAPIGALMFFYGSWLISETNHYFKKLYNTSILFFILSCFNIFALATPLNTITWLNIVLYFIFLPFNIYLYHSLFKGVEAVCENEDTKAVVRFNSSRGILNYCIMNIIAIISLFLPLNILAIAFTIVFIIFVRKLLFLNSILSDNGYTIKLKEAKKIKHLKLSLISVLLIIALLLPIVSYFSNISYIKPLSETGKMTDEILEIKNNLVSLGMEETIANDLLPEELALYKGATSVAMYSYDRTFKSDKSNLKITTCAVKLTENRSRILHFMEWLTPPMFRGADALSFDFNKDIVFCTDNNISVTSISETSGKKVYFKSDERAQFQIDNFFTVSEVNLFEVPLGKGSNLRMYISFEVIVPLHYCTGFVINYYHKPFYVAFPYKSAEDFVKKIGNNSSFNFASSFDFVDGKVTSSQ